MSQIPPAPNYPQPTLQPHPRGNPAALTSLGLGIIGCVPVITGVLAIVFGAIGIRRARDPRAGGRSFAIAGLALGFASVAFWAYIAATVGMTWIQSRPQRALVREFLQDLNDRNIPAAMSISAPTMGQDRAEAWRDRLSPAGPLKDVQVPDVYYQKVNGTQQWVLHGKAIYVNAEVPVTITTVWIEDAWKIYRLQLPRQILLNSYSAGPSTQPTQPAIQPIGP